MAADQAADPVASQVPDQVAVVASEPGAAWRGLLSALGIFVVLAGAYAVGSELSWQWFGASAIGIAFFPPAGVSVAALLLTRRALWPVIIAAIMATEITVDLQHSLAPAAAIGLAIANALESVTGASVTTWLCHGSPDLRVRTDLARFVGGACVAGPLVGALVGATVAALDSGSWWPGDLLQWWTGDGVAVLVVGTPILLWSRRRDLLSARRAEIALLAAVTAVLSVAIFMVDMPTTLLVLPVLAWAAFRLGDIAVVISGAIFAFPANYLTAAGDGNFAQLQIPGAAVRLVLQGYIAVIVLVGLLMAQEVSGRLGAVQERRAAQAERDRANARRAAAEVGTLIADTSSVAAVADLVIGAVRDRLGTDHAVINVLGDDQLGFVRLAGTPVPVTGDAALGAARVVAAMPLRTEAATHGYLDVSWTGPHKLMAAERDYLEALAEVASRGMERARLRQAEQQERQRLQTLAELTGLLAAALTPEDIGAIVTRQVRRDAGAHGVALGVISDDGRHLEWVAVTGYPDQVKARFSQIPLSTRTASTDAARSAAPVILRTLDEYGLRYPGSSRYMVQAGARSFVHWPLVVGEVSIGVLGLMWSEPQPLDASQLAFASAVSGLVAQSLLRARRFADEHAKAVILQEAVMPRAAAEIPGLDVGACYQPAGTGRGIGGDWYDAMPLPRGGVYLAVGDVVGHGLLAAQDMTQLRTAGRALAIQGHQPERLLAELSTITGLATHGSFATMAIAIVHPGDRLLTYGSAGHPPMLLRHGDGGTVTRLSCASGPALGTVDEAAYVQGRATLEHGDVLLMYTDGLVERRGEDIDAGIARAQEQLRQLPAGTALGQLCRDLTAELAPQPHDDDVCVLAAARQA